MKLKNLFLASVAIGALTACSSSDDQSAEPGATSNWLANAPGTEVYVGVEALNNLESASATTRAMVNPLAPTVKVTYFNVKVDPRLGYTLKPNTYTPGVLDGMLYTDCPFITINNGNDKSYLLSTDGSAMRCLIAAGDTTTANVIANVEKKYKRTGRISPTVVEDKIHVVWYLAKDMNNGWHIDGLLTDKEDVKSACEAARDEGFQEITFGENGSQLTYEQLMDFLPVDYKVKPIDKTLEVDINQQEHNTWGEIKTSIHIKEAKDVKVYLPISKDYTVENADTNEVAKYFTKTYEVQNYNETIGSDIKVNVERNATGVTIAVSGVTEELLKALERRYNDGLTVEVHTFYKLADEAGNGDYKVPVWNKLKESTVSYDGLKKGQITSAYNTEVVEIE